MRPTTSRRTAVTAGLLGTGGAMLVSLNGPVVSFDKVYEDRDVNVVAGGTPVPLSEPCAEALEQDGDVLAGPGAPDRRSFSPPSSGSRRQKLQFEHVSVRSFPGGRWNPPAMFIDRDVVACVSVDPGNIALTCPDGRRAGGAPEDPGEGSGQGCGSPLESGVPRYLERAVHVVVYKR